MRCIKQTRCKYTKHNQIHKRAANTQLHRVFTTEVFQASRQSAKCWERAHMRSLNHITLVIGFDQHRSKDSTEKERLAFILTCSPPLLQFVLTPNFSYALSLAPWGRKSSCSSYSAPPRGLKNFRCENWMQRFRFACFRFSQRVYVGLLQRFWFGFRFCNAFVYLQRVYVFGCVLCICSRVCWMQRMSCQINKDVFLICLCFVYLHVFS